MDSLLYKPVKTSKLANHMIALNLLVKINFVNVTTSTNSLSEKLVIRKTNFRKLSGSINPFEGLFYDKSRN